VSQWGLFILISYPDRCRANYDDLMNAREFTGKFNARPRARVPLYGVLYLQSISAQNQPIRHCDQGLLVQTGHLQNA
jgi:hypothetical protein